LGSLYGFNIDGKGDDPFYKISHDIPKFNGNAYASITGPGLIPYASLLLFSG
jgi:hypothetical protein